MSMNNNYLPVNEKTDIVEVFIKNNKNQRDAANAYRILYPRRIVPHFTTFGKIYRKFKATGSVAKGIRRNEVIAEDVEIDILAAFNANPYMSIRECADQSGHSYYRVKSTLTKYKYNSYKVKPVQHLHVGDSERRLQFCNWLHGQIMEEPNFAQRILWTDECNFSNRSSFNRKNTHYWSTENRHEVRATVFQNRFSINVWCGLVDKRIVGPFFYEHTLTGNRYLQFLQNEFQDFLDDLPLAVRINLIFQHDGAPAHNTIAVREFLNESFGLWIGRGGTIEWPARSPDLTPPDFYLWGAMKDFVYKENVRNLEHLKNRIRNFVTNYNEQVDFIGGLKKRLRLCLENNGTHFEQFL